MFWIYLYFWYFEALLESEQAWTSILNLKSFVMDSVQVGKAAFGEESYTTLGIEHRTYSNLGRYGNPYSVCWVKTLRAVRASFLHELFPLQFAVLPHSFSS